MGEHIGKVCGLSVMSSYKHQIHTTNDNELSFFQKANTPYVFLIYRCTWGPSLTTTPPRMTSSRAKRRVWSFKPVTSLRSSTSRILTGGKAGWRAVLLTSPDWYPPRSSRNGKQLCNTLWWKTAAVWSHTYRSTPKIDIVLHQHRPQNWAKNVNLNLFPHCRRVASKSKAREGSQSCSPFGKKKKCKDKYLAKHSSSECSSGIRLSQHCSMGLSNTKSLLLQFLTSWMWFLTRRLFSSLLLKGKHWCLLVSMLVFTLFISGIKLLKV